jgi:DMSO/TMAO reductase YedYZ molybdopterin-dependent catalytic subunit
VAFRSLIRPRRLHELPSDQHEHPVTDRPDSTRPEATPPADPATRSRVAVGDAALSGLVAAAAALSVGELIAGLVHGIPSPIAAVGAAAIDYAPPGSKDVVVSLFGTNDKAALTILVAVAVLASGLGIGLAARRSLALAGWLVVGLVGVGGLASLRDPTAVGPLVVVTAALQAGVGLQVLLMLLAAARRTRLHPAEVVAAQGAAAAAGRSRREFLLQAGVLGVLAVAAGGFGRQLLSGRAAAQANASLGGSGGADGPITIPQAVDPAPSPGPDASFNIPGLTPVVVPDAQFYRIDTALITPSVDLGSWQLRVFGMVDKEVSLTYEELLQLPLIERYVTIACVSNEVGGNLVGNAKWTGVKLADVLDMAGVQAGATQIVPRSIDGWTAGFPTEWIRDPAHPRDAIIAVKMNDAVLPAEHGFPARLIVPGLYGYVSATKWLTEIELTTLEAVDAYWVPRGWAKEAPILTQSRIDVPQSGANVTAGPVAVAGVAWAPDRGISKVELSIDKGPWQVATLATELSPATWVQWKYVWQAVAGQHTIEVRATDGTGVVQTAQPTSPAPDGARGHHTIVVTAS